MGKRTIWVAAVAVLVIAAAFISESKRGAAEKVELPPQALAVVEKAPEAEREDLRRILEAPFRRLVTEPDMRARLEAIGPHRAKEEGRRLALAGIWMLPDSLMIERTRLMDKIERRVSTEDCASIASGAPTDGVLERGLATFDAMELAAWYEVSVDASLRALRNDPAERLPTDSQGQALLQKAAERMPARLQAILYEPGRVEQAPPADMCNLDLHLNRFVIERGSPDGTTLIRWLMSKAGGAG